MGRIQPGLVEARAGGASFLGRAATLAEAFALRLRGETWVPSCFLRNLSEGKFWKSRRGFCVGEVNRVG